MSKAAYVSRQGQTRKHTCHWPGCERQVPPAMWGCKPHWFQLPKHLRNKIWATYRPGQEIDGRPHWAYIDAAREVQEWIAQQSPNAGVKPHSFAASGDQRERT